MSDRLSLLQAEADVDNAFASNALGQLPFAKAAWTILSFSEDLHLFQLSKLEADQAAIYADGLMNALTYPLRICHQTCAKGPFNFDRKLVNEEYQLASDWLDAAEGYSQFCTLFPLFHAGDITLRIDGNRLVASDWTEQDLSYEAYDRFVGKREMTAERILDANLVHREVRTSMRRNGGVYSVDFSAKLLLTLVAAFGEYFEERHSLPGTWTFSCFTLSQYRAVFTCLQCMTYGWFVARQIASNDGATAVAFSSAVWTPRKSALVALVARHTGVPKPEVQKILTYLTFGEVGVRSPDIAIQPLVDLTNGQYAISPFVLTNVNAERNLCVLLNQIPADRKIYSQLVNEKENELRRRIQETLQGLDLQFRHGDVNGTDIDLAIVDHAAKLCLCLEIKWFIEPAEVRELRERSEEIRKGVSQALAIAKQVKDRSARVLSLLQIDHSYEVMAVVGSENSIGHARVQHLDVPVVKVWQLAAKIRDEGLRETIRWLRSREYLPVEGKDFQVTTVEFVSGPWTANWYGLAPISAASF